MSWYIALKDPWRRLELPEALTVANDETGEIIEWRGGFDALYRSGEMDSMLLGRIARALGPDIERRWESDEGEGLDLAAEVRRLVAERRTHGIDPPTPAQRAAQAEAYRRLAEDPEAD